MTRPAHTTVLLVGSACGLLAAVGCLPPILPVGATACDTVEDCSQGQDCIERLCVAFIPRDAGWVLFADAGTDSGQPPDAGPVLDGGAPDSAVLGPDGGLDAGPAGPDAAVLDPDGGLDAGPPGPDGGIDAGPLNCGDGVIDPDEDCDDGNDAAGDGCVGCAVVPGYGCFGEPSLCLPNACAPGTAPFTPFALPFDNGAEPYLTLNAAHDGPETEVHPRLGPLHDIDVTVDVLEGTTIHNAPLGWPSLMRLNDPATVGFEFRRHATGDWAPMTGLVLRVYDMESNDAVEAVWVRDPSGRRVDLRMNDEVLGGQSIVFDEVDNVIAGSSGANASIQSDRYLEIDLSGYVVSAVGLEVDPVNVVLLWHEPVGVCVGTCGNGALDDDEECDLGGENGSIPGYGCSAQCTWEAAYCGDDAIDFAFGEACDDGDEEFGDGCHPLCGPEEVEPNNNRASAQPITPGAPVIGDVDWCCGDTQDHFVFTAQPGTDYLIEAFVGGLYQCRDGGAGDTRLITYDDEGSPIENNNNSGPNNCAQVVHTQQSDEDPEDITVRVSAAGNDDIDPYYLLVTALP